MQAVPWRPGSLLFRVASQFSRYRNGSRVLWLHRPHSKDRLRWRARDCEFVEIDRVVGDAGNPWWFRSGPSGRVAPRAISQQVPRGPIARGAGTIAASGNTFSSLSIEACPNLLRTVIEYIPQVPRHSKAMRYPAQQSERKSILDGIRDQGAALDFPEPVRVAPKFVRALRLDINEFVRWVPPLDLRQPAKRNSSDAQRVGDGRSRLHHDRRPRENPEMHPRRSDLSQILRAGEEIENCGQRMRHPQFPAERIAVHQSPFAESSLDTSDESVP